MKKYLAIALAALMTVACATKKQAPQPKHGLDPAKFAAEYHLYSPSGNAVFELLGVREILKFKRYGFRDIRI